MAKDLVKQDDMDLGIDMSDMMMIMMMVMMVSLLTAVIPATTQTTQALQALQYRGITDPREVRVDDRFMWIDLIHDPPYKPWVHAFIINDGPDPVQIGLNHPSDLEVLGVDETRTVDRTGADEKIMSIFFKCLHGQKALVRITGEY